MKTMKRVAVFALTLCILFVSVPLTVFAEGRYTVSNIQSVTGQEIVEQARKWANSGVAYWSGYEPWLESVYWRTGYTYGGQTSFDCSGFVARVLNDCGFRSTNYTPGYGSCILSQTYGSGYIGISIEELINYGTDITAAVLKAKSGDYGSGNYYHSCVTNFEIPASYIADQGGRQSYGGTGSGAPACGYNFYYWFRNPSADVYTYTYQTREKINQFYRWSGWSSWSDEKVTSSEDREVKTRTVYRYKADGLADHSYSDSCDTACNICGATRKAEHIYIGDCSTKCKNCGATRTAVGKHTFAGGVVCQYCDATFGDVSATSWQIGPVAYAYDRDLMAGKGTDAQGRIKFDPNSPITREEFVQVLYNAEGKPTVSSTKDFPDVASGGWYKNAVLWAYPETKLIYSYAFYGCKSLKSVTIPEKVINIGSYAFLSCTSLQSVKMSDGITSVGDGAFGSCTNLRNIVIPDSVTIVGDEAFSGCTSLESITIPDSITAIPDRAFSYCISLQSIIIPESVTFIGWHAFLGCSGLRNITIPDGITSIDISTFCNCVNLQSVKIPHNVTYIRESAFSGCTSLQGITIPETVTSIARGVFSDCTSLNVVYYYGTEEQKNRITIKDENTYLTNAQWHYEVTDVKLGEQVVYHCGCCNKYHSPDGSENVFADIKNTSWQISHAVYACRKGLMAGKGTDANGKIKFDPNSPITREEFVQVLYNAEGKPTVSSTKDFPDVASGGWYKNAVLWAYENNIASGMGNGNFGVGKNITRQDLALMLMKYAALKGCSLNAEAGKIDKFADGDKVSDYAKNAMNWAVTNGILSGKGESGKPLSTFRLDPTGTATRAECAAMLKNFMTAFNL